MSNEIIFTSHEFQNRKLNQYTKQIFKEGFNIKKSYARIAVALSKIDSTKCYETDGFKDVHDYAKQVLGINKSQSYAFLKIGAEYIDTKTFESVLHHEDTDFSLTQIQALLPLKSVEKAKELAETRTVSPDMTVKEIKEIVKEFTNPKTESESEDESSEGIIEADVVESSRFTVESVIELIVDEDGTTGFMYGDERLSHRDVVNLITEWANNKTFKK